MSDNAIEEKVSEEFFASIPRLGAMTTSTADALLDYYEDKAGSFVLDLQYVHTIFIWRAQ